MSSLRAHTSTDSSVGPNVNLDVSALFDELAVQLRSDSNSLSEAKQVAYLLDKAKFQKLVAKGANLHELMITEPTESAQSSFTDVQDLQKWGYHQPNSNDPTQLRKINKVLETIGVSAISAGNHSPNIPVCHTHEHTVVVEGTLYPASYALLCQVINPSHGLIVAYDNVTVRGVDTYSGCNDSQVPRLSHWSDIAYLQWLSRAGTDTSLRFVLRYNVLNRLTCFAVKFMSSHSGLVLTEWPGTTYYARSDEFNALLGSPNGRGVAHLLIQHKKQLGHKTVEKVTVFGTYYETMLLFQINDVEY